MPVNIVGCTWLHRKCAEENCGCGLNSQAEALQDNSTEFDKYFKGDQKHIHCITLGGNLPSTSKVKYNHFDCH